LFDKLGAISALNELEATSGFLATVFLAFLDASVSGQEAASSEFLAELFVNFKKGSGNTELNGTGLAGDAAAFGGGFDVIRTVEVEVDQRTSYKNFEYGATEVFGDRAAIDRDLAFTGRNPDTGDGAFASTGAVALISGSH
jgi:hypothetical protein